MLKLNRTNVNDFQLKCKVCRGVIQPGEKYNEVNGRIVGLCCVGITSEVLKDYENTKK